MTLGETLQRLKELTDEDFDANKKEIVALIKTIEVPELIYEDNPAETVSRVHVPSDWWN
jgi:hypothetical protein